MKFFRPGEEGGELAEVFLLERLQGVARLFEIGGHFGGGAGRLQRGRQATKKLLQDGYFHSRSSLSLPEPDAKTSESRRRLKIRDRIPARPRPLRGAAAVAGRYCSDRTIQ